jgi:hypothetical protein
VSPPPDDLPHHGGEPVGAVDFLPIVVAKGLLIDVSEEVEASNRNAGAFERTLQSV